MKGLCILGSTGSIGVNTLDVVARHPDRYRVVALTARDNVDVLSGQCLAHRPRYAVVADGERAGELEGRLRSADALGIAVLAGREALEEVARLPEVDYVMAAIVGAAGLLPTLAAAKAGKRILLANKESLVMSGDLLIRESAKSGAEILPIDSEHNAIFQCMPANYQAGTRAATVRRVLLTASGGPFLKTPLSELPRVTPEQACAHPNWVMGRKISVDSATMMNKGLELIEAGLLFKTPAEKIQVVIHRQSVIHSMVDYIDGTVLAQMGNPDMRIPIAHALAWPDRFESGAEPLDLFGVERLDFESPDETRFPCLGLARSAAKAGGTGPTVLNAANEIAVEAFLNGAIRFTDIADVIRHCMDSAPITSADGLDVVLSADRAARLVAKRFIEQQIRI